MRCRQGAAAATQLRSMAEDADDSADSAVPDEPEPEPTGEEADAPPTSRVTPRRPASWSGGER